MESASVSVGRDRDSGPEDPAGNAGEPQQLPLRWALIVLVAAGVGVLAGDGAGLVEGILAAGATAIGLHALIGDPPRGGK
jgi:hypothetical protein